MHAPCSINLIHSFPEAQVIPHGIAELPTFEAGASTIHDDHYVLQSTDEVVMPVALVLEIHHLTSRTTVSTGP